MTTFFSPEKEYIYDIFSQYYDNPLLYKIKSENGVSIFGVQLPSLLLNEKRFLIVTFNGGFFEQQRLRNIPWTTLQVRTLTNNNEYNHLPIFKYKRKKFAVYNQPLKVTTRTKDITHYKTKKLPIEVSLLHTKGLEYEYPNEGTLISALETFQTVIKLKD
jgi:hypothetical protein